MIPIRARRLSLFAGNPGGAPPTGVGGPKIYLRLKEPKDTYATSRSRRRIHPHIIGGLLRSV